MSYQEPEHPPDMHLADGLSSQHLQPLMLPSSTLAPLNVSLCLHVHSGLGGANLYPPEQNQRKAAKSGTLLNIQHKHKTMKKDTLKIVLKQIYAFRILSKNQFLPNI